MEVANPFTAKLVTDKVPAVKGPPVKVHVRAVSEMAVGFEHTGVAPAVTEKVTVAGLA